MTLKLFIDCKILLEFLKSRKWFKGSYSEFINGYISEMISTNGKVASEIKDEDNSNIYKLTTLYRENGEYFRDSKVYYLERPNGMLQEEVFTVIAHNREYFERFYKNFDKSICELTAKSLIDVFGFTQIGENEVKGRHVVELFFLKEYDLYFVNSHWFDNHIFWYEENLGSSEDDIIGIYDRINSNISRRLREGE